MSIADEIIVKLTAQTGGLNAGMDEAAAKVKTSTDAMNASVSNAMNTFRDFDNIQKGSIKTAQDVAAAQKTLEAATASNAFTTDELAAKQAILDAAMLKVGKGVNEASGALGLLTRNSRTAYSASALISDALTGQFSRSRREIAALANETGLMSSAFRIAIGPAGLVAGAIAAVAALAYEGSQRIEEFQQALERSNDASRLSAADLESIATSAGDATNSYNKASEAVKELAADGRFSADQINDLTVAVVQYAIGTGESVKDVMRVVTEIANDPKKALEELAGKMGAINSAQKQHIEQLLAQGQKQEAIDEELAAFESRGTQAFKNVNDQASGLSKGLDSLGHKFDNVIHDMEWIASNNFWQGMLNPSQAVNNAMAATAEQAKKTAQAVAAARAANKPKGDDKGSFGAFQQEGEQGVDLSGNLAEQLRTLEVAQKVSYDERKSFESEYWAYVLSKVQQGSSQYIEAYRNLEAVDHELSETSQRAVDEVERKREEAARKGTEAAKRASEAAQRAEDQEAAHVQDEMRKETAAREEAARKAMELARQVADTEVGTADFIYQMKMVSIKGAEKLGITSAQQALQQEITADQQLYQAKLDAYGKELTAAKGNAIAMAAIQKQITQAEHEQDLKRAQFAIQQQEIVAQKYKQMMQPIVGAFQQSINGMIQGTQTFKQAMANMGQSIVAEFLNQELEMLTNHIATEMAKREVTIASNEAQVAANEAGQAESLAIQGAAAVKWIITEAAKAAAGAFNALVSIPYVGPFLAVGASIAAFAAVSKLVSSVASAEGGWERVPADGMMTELHRDEMVLPKNVADPVRKMARGGGGDGDHFHFHAHDAKSFADYARRNKGELAKLARQMSRQGYRV